MKIKLLTILMVVSILTSKAWYFDGWKFYGSFTTSEFNDPNLMSYLGRHNEYVVLHPNIFCGSSFSETKHNITITNAWIIPRVIYVDHLPAIVFPMQSLTFSNINLFYGEEWKL